MARIKKICLPPTNLKGIKSYLSKRGYRINPIFQSLRPKAKLTFDKPLPDGRRLHGEVIQSKRRLYVKQHIDRADPSRNPLGHLMVDYGTRHRTSLSVIRRKPSRKKPIL